jgi:NADPH-dependent 2,4-dienoyl-CoA reductase/sulfur reductase-like enzyme/nitrite reductase/ring-hydroxylating ferredoxin subunit
MAGQTQPAGPDFAAGIDASTVKPGEKLLGHVGDESVLLANLDGEFVAIAASCTHYGGPLAEGVIDGDTVRCPWHHACFNLRTGEALRSPALSPVACWKTERRGDTIVVTNKVERDPLAPTYPIAAGRARAPNTVVIVGAGAAGSAAAEMLRRCGFGGRVTIVDDDTGSPYDRPNLSKDYLAGNAPEEWIPLRPDDFYAQHAIEVVRGRVTRLDVKAKTIDVDGKPPMSYDVLLLATGAEPVRLDTPGSELPHVHYLRSLADSRAIIAASKNAKRAVVIGSSFIGLEVAASLRARGVDVHVIAPEKIPLARVIGDQLGAFVRSLHEEKGVTFHLEHTATRIATDHVILDDGARVDADLVVIGVGVRPRLQLAESAGLAMDRGVTVNEFLETSADGVFAAGDIARWPDPHSGESIRVEHWVVAERHGQNAALNMMGRRERFAAVPFFWSQHYDVPINYVGHAEKWDEIAIDGDVAGKDCVLRYRRGGRTLAVASIYRDVDSLKAEVAMERETAA